MLVIRMGTFLRTVYGYILNVNTTVNGRTHPCCCYLKYLSCIPCLVVGKRVSIVSVEVLRFRFNLNFMLRVVNLTGKKRNLYTDSGKVNMKKAFNSSY